VALLALLLRLAALDAVVSRREIGSETFGDSARDPASLRAGHCGWIFDGLKLLGKFGLLM
jgi:hypothetical protein